MAVEQDGLASDKKTVRSLWRGKRKWWIITAGALLLLWAAPFIVAKTSLLQLVVDASLKDLRGRLVVDSASLGWFSSSELHGVQLLDAEGVEAAAVERLEIQKSLWQLLWSRDEFGELVVVAPHLNLVVASGTTNLEQILQPWLEQETAAAPIKLHVKIEQGTATLQAASSEDTTELDNIQGDVQLGASQELELSARVWDNPAEASSGGIDLKASLDPRKDEMVADVLLTHVNLRLADLFTKRFGINVYLKGQLTGHFAIRTDSELTQGEVTWEEVAGQTVQVRAPDYLGTDQPSLNQVTSQGRLQWQDRQVIVPEAVVQSDVIAGRMQGELDLDHPEKLWNASAEGGFETQGVVDLAVAARQLPQTLRLREGIEVRAGNLQWTVRSHLEGGRRRLFMNLRTGRLDLADRGQPFSLEQPLTLSGAVIQTREGPTLEFVSCKSAFLDIEGGGSPYQGQVTVVGSLDELQRQFGQFLSLDETSLGGRVEGQIRWNQQGEGTVPLASGSTDLNVQLPEQIAVGGDLTIRQVNVQIPGRPPYQEDELTLSASGLWFPLRPWASALQEASLLVVAGTDRLELTPQPSRGGEPATGTQVASAKVVGDLQRWLARSGVSQSLSGYQMGGQVELTADVLWSAEAVGINNGSLTINDLQVVSSDIQLREPRAVGVLVGGYNLESGDVYLQTLTMATSSASLRVDELQFPTRQTGGTLSGRYALRADLARVARWLPEATRSGWRCAGQLEGSGQLNQQRVAAQSRPWGVDYTGTITDFEVELLQASTAASPPATSSPANSPAANNRWVWREPLVKVDWQGAIDLTSGRIQLPQAQVQGGTQLVALAGELYQERGQWHVAAEGRWAGNGHQWVNLLGPWLGDDAQLAGEFNEPFSIQGPLQELELTRETPRVRQVSWPPESLSAQAGLAWQSGRVLGLPFGTGAIRPSLARQVVDFGEIHIPLSQGDVHLNAKLSMQGEQPTLYVGRGRVLNQVVLTPQMSRRWVVYAAPLLAQVTSTEGTISLDVEDSVLPINDPTAGSGGGKLFIQRAVVGPGPLAKQLLALVEQVKALATQQPLATGGETTWLELPQQEVTFKIQQGRVYHDQLRAQVGDVVIVTRGSVGRDETLDLVVSVPVQDRWLQNRPELAVLRGLKVEVPVRGTLSSPKVDTRALSDLSKQLLQQATGQLLDQQLRRGLDKLFGGQQP